MDLNSIEITKWEGRIMLICFPTEKQALKYASKHQSEYDVELKIDTHYKDGYVVYYSKK